MVTTLVILQAAILGVLIGGGFWFRHVVNQQLRLKDSQNAVLRAERDQARTAAAPALAQEWMTTSKALDEMTGQKQKLQQDFDQFKTQVGKAGADATGPFYRGIGFGCLEGAMAIKHLFYDYYATKGTSLPTRFFQALVKQHNELLGIANSTMAGKTPQLNNVGRYFSENGRLRRLPTRMRWSSRRSWTS